jgi:guanylate kinase
MFFLNKPSLVAISGVSGTGKTTLIRQIESHLGNVRVITHTSRPPRTGESASDYKFCTLEEINSLQDTLWVKENYGNKYAVTGSSITKIIGRSGIAFLPTISTHHGELRDFCKSVAYGYIGIHLAAPAPEDLRQRMLDRGDFEPQISDRLKKISAIEASVKIDTSLHIISPGTMDEVFQTVMAIIATHQ